jgi:hypothetical protein
VLSLGHSGILLKEQGSHDLDTSLRDTEGLSERPMCIGSERA